VRCLLNETVNSDNHFWFEKFYKARSASLILYGRALGLSHGEAEDVLQETFLTLMQKAGLPREPENYLLRSFRNRALNYKRSLWRRLTRELEVFTNGHHWFEKYEDETQQLAQAAALRCLEKLSLEQREVIVLKIWNRLTFEEIGGILEISPNTAAGRYRYGLQKIKTRLEGENYGRDELDRETIAFVAAAPSVGGA